MSDQTAGRDRAPQAGGLSRARVTEPVGQILATVLRPYRAPPAAEAPAPPAEKPAKLSVVRAGPQTAARISELASGSGRLSNRGWGSAPEAGVHGADECGSRRRRASRRDRGWNGRDGVDSDYPNTLDPQSVLASCSFWVYPIGMLKWGV
jgi:hypothetical protein